MKQFVDCVGQPLEVGGCIVYTQRGTEQLTFAVIVALDIKQDLSIQVIAHRARSNRLLNGGRPLMLSHNDRILAIPFNILPQMLSIALRFGVQAYHEGRVNDHNQE